MTAQVYVCKNLKTGKLHTVPEGHFAFRDPTYEILGTEEEWSESQRKKEVVKPVKKKPAKRTKKVSPKR